MSKDFMPGDKVTVVVASNKTKKGFVQYHRGNEVGVVDDM